MENASLTSDVWSDVTTSSSKEILLTLYLAHIRYVALKVIYIIIGSVGIIDNLFIVIIFAFFVKIGDKVFTYIHTTEFIERQNREERIGGAGTE